MEDVNPEIFQRGLVLEKKCEYNNMAQEQYWRATVNTSESLNDTSGILFHTISEKVAGSLKNYSIITFYVSFVFVIVRILRQTLFGGAHRIILSEMPNPDDLLLLCEGILISRLERNLVREGQLYYTLIDLLRSPELLKVITGSSIRKRGS